MLHHGFSGFEVTEICIHEVQAFHQVRSVKRKTTHQLTQNLRHGRNYTECHGVIVVMEHVEIIVVISASFFTVQKKIKAKNGNLFWFNVLFQKLLVDCDYYVLISYQFFYQYNQDQLLESLHKQDNVLFVSKHNPGLSSFGDNTCHNSPQQPLLFPYC